MYVPRFCFKQVLSKYVTVSWIVAWGIARAARIKIHCGTDLGDFIFPSPVFLDTLSFNTPSPMTILKETRLKLQKSLRIPPKLNRVTIFFFFSYTFKQIAGTQTRTYTYSSDYSIHHS